MERAKINELKKTVWVIWVRDRDETLGHGYLTAVCIGKNRILSCCHGICDSSLIYGRKFDEDLWRPLETVWVRPCFDVRLLKVKKGFFNVNDFQYAPISDNQNLVTDQMVYHIGHPSGLSYSFLPGKVAYPCVEVPPSAFLKFDSLICDNHEHDFNACLGYKTLGCMSNKSSSKVIERQLLEDLRKHSNPMTPIVLLLGMGTVGGSSGGPIFKVNGEIVGILARVVNGYGVAIHVSVLKAVINEANSIRKKADGKRFFQSTSLPNFDASRFVEPLLPPTAAMPKTPAMLRA